MDNPGIKNLGEKNPITTAVSDLTLTSAPDSSGVSQSYVDRLTDMGSATFFVDFEWGSGGTTAILTIDTSLDQGDNWIEIARFDFATTDRIAALTVSGAAPADVSSLAALGAEGKRDGFLGDRLRARLTTTGTYAGNTSIKVRAFVRSAGAGTNAADDLAQYVDGLETLLTALNGYTDGLETGQAGLAATLTAIQGYVDGLESGQAGLQSTLTAIQGFVDGLETLGTAHSTKLDTLHTDIATTLTGLITTLNGYVDGLETLAAAPLAAGSAVIGKVEGGYTATVTFTPAAAAYLSNDVMDVAKEIVFLDRAGNRPLSGAKLRILSTELRKDASAVTSGETSYRLETYGITPPSALADNAAWDVPSGDRASYKGSVFLGSPIPVAAASPSTCNVETKGVDKDIKLTGDSLFGYFVTNSAFTAVGSLRTATLHAVLV